MPRFRKKPVVIEAVQWMKDGHGGLEGGAPPWISEAMQVKLATPGSIIRMGDSVHIFTLEGMMKAMPGDWIIRGVKGELYPCKPDIFEQTYEAVKE